MQMLDLLIKKLAWFEFQAAERRLTAQEIEFRSQLVKKLEEVWAGEE
jgi:hypothetical protein